MRKLVICTDLWHKKKKKKNGIHRPKQKLKKSKMNKRQDTKQRGETKQTQVII